MLEHGVNRLPIVNRGSLVRIVTRAAIRIGKLKGMICATTPSGSLKWCSRAQPLRPDRAT
jgi:hypothetical protein